MESPLEQSLYHQILNSEYVKIRERCEELENELFQARSQIKSMKIALTYSDTFTLRKVAELHDEIERLKESLAEKTVKKKRKESVLAIEISKKSEYIDDLVVKLQNLFQKSEYYKEDMFKYQYEYSKTKDLLEKEVINKEALSKTLQETHEKFYMTQEDLKERVNQLEIFKIEKEKTLQEIMEKINEKWSTAFSRQRDLFESEKAKQTRSHCEILTQVQDHHSKAIESFKKFIENKIQEISRYYENRITSLITEIGLIEAKYQEELIYAKGRISNIEKENKDLLQMNSYLLVQSEDKAEAAKLLEKIIDEKFNKESDEIVESRVIIDRFRVEMENSRIKFEESRAAIVEEYEKTLRIKEKSKEDEIGMVRQRFNEDLKKIQNEASQKKFKERKHYEVQIEVLLAKIENLEKEKSMFECLFKERKHIADKELVEKVETYEKKINKIEVRAKENLKKSSTYSELMARYKEKVRKNKEKYEKIINELDISYSLKINEISLGYESKIEEEVKLCKETYEKLIQELNSKNSELEKKLVKVRADFREIMKDNSEKIEDLSYDADFAKRQLFQKQIQFQDTETEYKQKIKFMESQLEDTNILMAKIEKDFGESKEKVSKEIAYKVSELNFKHNTEKADLQVKAEKAYSDLQIYYNEKLKRKKAKYTLQINNLNSTLKSTIDGLSSKLTVKKKVAKNQKAEIRNLKMHLKYMDSTIKIFTPIPKTPTSSIHKSSPQVRKGFLLRPVSVAADRPKLH